MASPEFSTDPRPQPLVSIGLPTYNGARHLRESLDCLLGQDYRDLEVLISDNASTDDTYAIATEYAGRDARVRVIRQRMNLGPTANFMHVFRETRGPFFMWASDDDRWSPDFVSTCVAALETNASAVLAATSVRFVEGEEDVPPADHVPELYDNPDLSSPDPAERLSRLMSRAGWYLIYGLIRRSVLQATRLFTSDYGSDVVLTVELAARGPIVVVPRQLFTYRVMRQPEPDRGAWSQSVIGLPDVRSTAYSRLQEACCAGLASAGLGWWQHQRAHAALLAACYLRPTPIRARIDSEVLTRFRLGVTRRDYSDVLKYGVLRVLLGIRHRRERLGVH